MYAIFKGEYPPPLPCICVHECVTGITTVEPLTRDQDRDGPLGLCSEVGPSSEVLFQCSYANFYYGDKARRVKILMLQ